MGELGYELHCPSPAAEFLWDRLVAEGARPFGLEPQRILRLEKGHVIVGQDTDSESNLLSAAMPWLPKMDKDDFVGKLAVEHFSEREPLERLVGFVMEDGVVPAEGAQIVIEGYPAGRITSARRSEAVGSVIGLAWLPVERAEDGTRFEVRVDRQLLGAGSSPGFLRRRRKADAVVSLLDFLSPSRCADGTTTSPLRRALEGRRAAVVQDLWPHGKVEIRGDLDLVAPTRGEELVRLTPRRGFLFTATIPPTSSRACARSGSSHTTRQAHWQESRSRASS